MKEEKNLGGRPRKYATPQEFDAAVEAYVKFCKENPKEEIITWTGLALHLGFSSRQSIDEYGNYPGFSDSVRRAKLIVENAYEKRVNGNNATGPIFVLKNMGWADRQELDHSSKDRSMSPNPKSLDDFYKHVSTES